MRSNASGFRVQGSGFRVLVLVPVLVLVLVLVLARPASAQSTPLPPELTKPVNDFANVIDVGGIGLAISTDGVGSKLLIAQLMDRYDTVGIDCIAMNVNDVLCVGAEPLSMVDYIAVQQPNPRLLTELLRWANGNVSRAARKAQLDRMHLHRLFQRYALRSASTLEE